MRRSPSSCSEALIQDGVDRAIAARAAAASSSTGSLSTPDTQTVEGRRVPTLRLRHGTSAPTRGARHGPPASISRHLPIWYSLPSLDAFRRARADAGEPCTGVHKPDDFAPMRPGRAHTYKYETQAEYYKQYARALYAITAPRAGLDCLRHYEILASGAVPFFVDSAALDAAPLSMYAFPRELVRE